MIVPTIKYAVQLLFVFSLSIYSQSSIKIQIEGNDQIDSEAYEQWVDEFKTGFDSSSSFEKFILEKLWQEGFLSAKIEAKNQNDSTKIFKVKEGEPALIHSFTFPFKSDIDSLISKNLNEIFSGARFTKPQVESAIDYLLTKNEESGFPFAEIQLNNITTLPKKNEVIINLNVNKNISGEIDSIKINGNDKTSRAVILRNIGVEKGDYFSEEILTSIPQELNKLRFFEIVPRPNYFFNSDNTGILEINVTEINTNNFDGIIGYIPSNNEDEDGFFTGYLNLGFRNIFGTGRNFGFKWEKEDRSSQFLEIKYMEPWILSLSLNLNLNFFQRQQDSTFVKRRIKSGFEFMASETITASLLLSSESVIPTLNQRNPTTLYNSDILSAGINFILDSRDDFYSPQKGVYFSNTYFYSSKSISNEGNPNLIVDQSDFNMQQVEVDLMYFQKIFSRQVAMIGISWREIDGSFLETSDLYQFGGTNTLRGYRENQFLGNRLVWSNIEYRLLLSARTFFSVFYDYGYYLVEEKVNTITQSDSQFLYGYGLGINLETGLGVLRVNYAVGKGDQISEGKLHFGLLNEF